MALICLDVMRRILSLLAAAGLVVACAGDAGRPGGAPAVPPHPGVVLATPAAKDKVVPGFADLHNHQFADRAFGGNNAIYGSPTGDPASVLGDCSGPHW